MKKSIWIRLLCICLTLTFILSLACTFVSCTDKNGDESNKSNKSIVLAQGGASEYTVVYPAEGSAVVKNAAEAIAEAINKETGASVSAVADTQKESKYEILVGETNREQSASAKEKLTEGQYVIAAVGAKVCVYAQSDSYYKTAASYFENAIIKNGKCTLIPDYLYEGNKITFFTVDEKVADTGVTSVDITVTPDSSQAQPGIFIGKEYGKGMFGYQGYCFIVTKNKVTLYKFDDKLEEMSSKKFDGFKKDEPVKLRLEIEKKACRAYVLDDPEGIEPWPEFDMEIKSCKGYELGYLELSGNGASYKDLSVSYGDGHKGKTYTNAILDGYADPDVLYHDGTYYLYATGGSGYLAHSSKDLVNWKSEKTAVRPNLWGITSNYWAPDVEYINGKFYMVVSCNEHLGIAVSDSPLGPFVENSEKVLFDKTIDGHIFVDDDGSVYLYYVSWRSSYAIYGVKLDQNMNPVMSTEKRIIAPTEQWEKYEGNVTEGPYMLKHNGKYYLTYSGSHYKSPNYAVGYAVSDKPLGTFKKYADNPIMIGNTQIAGVGHHCITYTPDGKEMIIVYHCHNSVTQVQTRKLCIDKIRFVPVEGDIDRLEVYGPTTSARPYPFGE